MYKHILISSDGSELAQRGVDQGLALAKAIGARVSFVVVSELFTGNTLAGEPPLPVFPAEADVSKAGEAAAKKLLAKLGEQARSGGVACDQVHVRDKLPADGILDTVAERKCDLIVMSSHGRRGLERLLLGSQAAEVVARAKVSVLIAK
jgi:nucleotide-binding universal stress UspA family protein